MAKNIELEQLVINKLTQEQFDSIEEKNPAELYFITDAEVDGGKGAQVEEMPEATEMNAGQIVQYVGETIPDVEATAIVTQTVGDSLTDLKVDTKKFEKASGLTEAGSLEFVAEVRQGEVANVVFTEGENAPGSYIETTTEDFVNFLSQIYGVDINSYPAGYFLVWNPEGSAENIWSLCDIYGNLLGEAMQYETIEASGLNVAYAAFSSSFGGTATGLYNLRIIHGDYACGYMLSNASSLTDIQLDSLESVSGSSACSSMFATNSALEKAYFYSLTEVLTAGALGTSSSTCMFYNCTAMTELHFRADAQAVIEGLTAYQYKFGATNATIYFDLIGTITVDGVEYARDEKQSIRVDGVKTFVGWKDANDNIVYTSCADNAEPAVDTVVYSDQGATQVGTVEAVA